MSNITLTHQNIVKFKKRLQKELCQHFNEDVKFHEAANILAKTIGTRNEFELIKVLEKKYRNKSR